ncbi:PAS domain S-box protein [Parvularcula sp. ZS-1/3]|uniref:Sensor protein FixL n=1 Tax=Parvularcula mediterranea TaxID=2732508 RepID=A0A7Y3W6R2_9PROT|nr:PAS domain-containing sensor histidine kinase [Parvularcula mediterranea]NNU17556.1 PAS domain S-box protein [Parvularcula mediterranea]
MAAVMELDSDDTELREQLGALIKTAVDAIVSIDSHGTVRLCNPAVERLFGWPAQDLVGKNVSVLMPEADAHRHDGYLARYMDGGDARIIGKGRKVRGKRYDGSEFPLHLSVGECTVSGERYFVGILRDLTAETHEQARLQQLEDQLALMGRRSAVSEMGASLAHELNQPLTAIDLFLTAAKRAFPKHPDQALALFEDARTEAQRAGAIVKRIRKMVEGAEHKRELFALKPVIEDAIELCRIADTANPATFEIVGADSVEVFGDEVQIRQVLVNLIKNALEATQHQNRRDVQIAVARQRSITVDVADNGPGVDQTIAAKLFEPFHSTKSGGLGIDLSICRSIAESHGGELLLVSQAGLSPGACFRLRLPDADEEIRENDR